MTCVLQSGFIGDLVSVPIYIARWTLSMVNTCELISIILKVIPTLQGPMSSLLCYNSLIKLSTIFFIWLETLDLLITERWSFKIYNIQQEKIFQARRGLHFPYQICFSYIDSCPIWSWSNDQYSNISMSQWPFSVLFHSSSPPSSPP